MNYYTPFGQNTLPTAQNVDMYLHKKPVVQGLGYQMTNCMPFKEGTYDMDACPLYQGTPLYNQKIKVEGKKMITLSPFEQQGKMFMTDNMKDLQQGMPCYGPQFGMYPDYGKMQEPIAQMPPYMCDDMNEPYKMYWDNRDTEITTQRSEIRVVHFSPNAGPVDIALPSGNLLFSNISYKDVTEYLVIAPGMYTLVARPSGTTQTALTIPNIDIEPGEIVTVYIIGLLNGIPNLEALVLTDNDILD